MKRSYIYVLIFGLLIIMSCGRQKEMMYFNLNNGMKVVFNHDDASITSAVIVIGAGSSVKPYNAADVLTKAIFEGSAIRTRQQIFQEIEMMGGRLRFWTTDAVSVIQIRAPSTSFLKCFSIVCETISNPLFNDAHINKVLTEAGPAALGPNSGYNLEEKDDIHALLFTDSDLVRSDSTSKGNLSPELLRKYYNTFYRPGNIITAVNGKFAKNSILQVLSTCWHPSEKDQSSGNSIIDTGRIAEESNLFRDTVGNTGKMLVAYKAPGVMEPGYYKTLLLSKILGDDLNSVVRSALDQAGLTSSGVHSYYVSDYGYGYMAIRIKAPKIEYARAHNTVIAALDTVRSAGMSEEYFNIGKRKVLFDVAFRMQYSSFNALLLASQVRSGYSCICPDEYRNRIDSISIDELNQYAAQFLDSPVIISYTPQ